MSIRDTIAESFRDLPLNDLIKEVQQPSGKYRLYDILGEIQLKKDQAAKMAAAQTQAPQTTVVQDLQQFVNSASTPGITGLPEAQPMMEAMVPPPEMPVQQMAQGGLADLDVGDMFNEQSYAGGGIVAFAEGGDTESSMNLDSMPSLDLNTGDQSGGNMVDMPNELLGTMFKDNPDLLKQLGLQGQDEPSESYALNLESGRQEPQAFSSAPAASVASYQGDINTPFMARGGYLNGPGDGLSDSIPATIEGKQPARLADGEFVVSADVVSGLGNGSSKAGAKKLYAMMDKVRQQAHGTKKQIRKVNANKVMPVA